MVIVQLSSNTRMCLSNVHMHVIIIQDTLALTLNHEYKKNQYVLLCMFQHVYTCVKTNKSCSKFLMLRMHFKQETYPMCYNCKPDV